MSLTKCPLEGRDPRLKQIDGWRWRKCHGDPQLRTQYRTDGTLKLRLRHVDDSRLFIILKTRHKWRHQQSAAFFKNKVGMEWVSKLEKLRFTALYPLHCTAHLFTARHYTALYSTTFHCTARCCTSLHWTATSLYSSAMHSTTQNFTAL